METINWPIVTPYFHLVAAMCLNICELQWVTPHLCASAPVLSLTGVSLSWLAHKNASQQSDGLW